MDRDYVVLADAGTLIDAGLPLLRVDEERDSEALMEVIGWPLPLELCVVLPTDQIPDRRSTNNTPGSSKGTFYGSSFFDQVATEMHRLG